jgi:hypothetical protein
MLLLSMRCEDSDVLPLGPLLSLLTWASTYSTLHGYVVTYVFVTSLL